MKSATLELRDKDLKKGKIITVKQFLEKMFLPQFSIRIKYHIHCIHFKFIELACCLQITSSFQLELMARSKDVT